MPRVHPGAGDRHTRRHQRRPAHPSDNGRTEDAHLARRPRCSQPTGTSARSTSPTDGAPRLTPFHENRYQLARTPMPVRLRGATIHSASSTAPGAGSNRNPASSRNPSPRRRGQSSTDAPAPSRSGPTYAASMRSTGTAVKSASPFDARSMSILNPAATRVASRSLGEREEARAERDREAVVQVQAVPAVGRVLDVDELLEPEVAPQLDHEAEAGRTGSLGGVLAKLARPLARSALREALAARQRLLPERSAGGDEEQGEREGAPRTSSARAGDNVERLTLHPPGYAHSRPTLAPRTGHVPCVRSTPSFRR